MVLNPSGTRVFLIQTKVGLSAIALLSRSDRRLLIQSEMG